MLYAFQQEVRIFNRFPHDVKKLTLSVGRFPTVIDQTRMFIMVYSNIVSTNVWFDRCYVQWTFVESFAEACPRPWVRLH